MAAVKRGWYTYTHNTEHAWFGLPFQIEQVDSEYAYAIHPTEDRMVRIPIGDIETQFEKVK